MDTEYIRQAAETGKISGDVSKKRNYLKKMVI
jgi:hypothetical protein